MATVLENLQARLQAVSDEIAALNCESSPERKKALYDELRQVNEQIQNAQGIIEEETLGYT